MSLSTKDVKKLSNKLAEKPIPRVWYPDSTRNSREALLLWQERSIEKQIAYLYLDAVNLPIGRDKTPKEALLSAVGVTDTGEKEFLDFL